MEPTMMHVKALLVYATLVMLITGTIPATGCSYDITKSIIGYNIFTMNKGIAKFTFEYNARSQIGKVDVEKKYTIVYLNGPQVGEAKDRTLISISVFQPEDGNSDYQSHMDESLRIASGFLDFKLLERFPVKICGEPGEQAVIYYKQPPLNEQILQGILPRPKIERSIIFTHDGLLWWMEIDGLESSAENDKTYFEQVVQTFQILE